MSILSIKEGSNRFSDDWEIPFSCRTKEPLRDKLKQLKKTITEIEEELNSNY